MQDTVFVQPRRYGGFIASVPTPPNHRSQGATEDEASIRCERLDEEAANHFQKLQYL